MSLPANAVIRSETCGTHGWFATGEPPCTCTPVSAIEGQLSLHPALEKYVDGLEVQINEQIEGERLKEEGAAAALEAETAEWRHAAEGWIEFFCTDGLRFTAEDIRRLAGDPPHHPNALGGLFISAARRGIIKPVGYEKASRKSGHARPIRVWVGA